MKYFPSHVVISFRIFTDHLLFYYLIISIHSDDEEELQKEDPPELEKGFGNTIVVDNVPIVRPEKFEKLERILRRILSPAAGAIKEDGFWMPVNADTNKTYGYCFIEYNTPQVVYILSVAFLILSSFGTFSK